MAAGLPASSLTGGQSKAGKPGAGEVSQSSVPADRDPGSALHLPNSAFYCRLDAQSCLTLCLPMDCSPPGSSLHGIFQARILKWVAMSFFPHPGFEPESPVLASGFFTTEPPGKPDLIFGAS